jgi:MFS family permease
VGLSLCSLGHRLWQLALARVVVGTGTGGIELLVTIIINDLVQLHELPLWTSTTAIAETAGLMLGAPVGAAITDRTGFRPTFGLEAICMLLAVVIMYATLRLPQSTQGAPASKAQRLEWPSAVLLLLSIAAPLFALNLGGEVFAWNSVAVIVLFCSTPIWLGMFYYTERYVAQTPIVPVRFLNSRPLAVAMLCILPMKFAFDQVRMTSYMLKIDLS